MKPKKIKLSKEERKIIKRIKERIYLTGGAHVFMLMNGEYTIRSKESKKVENLIERGAMLIGYFDKESTHKLIAESILVSEFKAPPKAKAKRTIVTPPKGAQWSYNGLYYKRGANDIVFIWVDHEWIKSSKKYEYES